MQSDLEAQSSSSDSLTGRSKTPGFRAHLQKPLPTIPFDTQISRTVKRSRTTIALDALYDVLLFACCLLFIVFAALVKIHGGATIQDDQQLYDILLKSAQYVPTVFPILFAAVGSRTIKTIIQWRLQHGARLGTLDLLASSTTVGGALTAQTAIQQYSILGAVLIVLWALSPVGGQASLRMISTGNDTTSQTFRYVLPGQSLSSWTGTDAIARKPLLNSMFFSLLLGSQNSRANTMDIWGNIKIPMLESLETGHFSDTEGWYDVASDSTDYASLVGVPISPRLETSMTSSTSLETWYWTLDCHNLTSNALWIMNQTVQLYATNSSSQTWKAGLCEDASVNGCLLSNFGSNTSYETSNSNRPLRQILFVADDYLGNVLEVTKTSKSAAICSIQTSYVELEIACVGQQCAAQKIRRSRKPSSVSAWTVFDCPTCSGYILSTFQLFANMFTDALEPGAGTARQSAISGYLANPDAPFAKGTYKPASTLAPRTYATRVSQLLNTYWLAAGGTSVLASGLGQRNGSEYNSYWDVRFNTSITSGTVIKPATLLECHDGWWFASIFTSAVLLLACLSTPILKFWIANPELALNFSSLVRDNVFLAGSESDSSLDAPERARLLRDTKIRFGDVRSGEDVGHLALASEKEGFVIEPARKGREYS